MPLLPRNALSKTQQQQQQQQHSPKKTDAERYRKEAPLVAAGALVSDTIVLPPDVAWRKAQAIKSFKVNRCTPRRQRDAASLALQAEVAEFEERQKELAKASAASAGARASSPPRHSNDGLDSGSSSYFPTRTATPIRSGRASPASAAVAGGGVSPVAVHQLGAASPSSLCRPASMTTPIYVQPLSSSTRIRGSGSVHSVSSRGVGASAIYSSAAAAAASVASIGGQQMLTALEVANQRTNLSAIKGDIDRFTMMFASDQERYEHIRSKIGSSKKSGQPGSAATQQQTTVVVSSIPDSSRKSDGSKNKREPAQAQRIDHHDDSDRSSSTDSIVLDPGVMGVASARQSARRQARLREHCSPSLHILNNTQAIGVNGSSKRGGGASSSPAIIGAGGGDSCVVLSYLQGLERLVHFCITTLSSKEELAALVAALSSIGGLQEAGGSFGRWPCFRQDTIDMRLEKLIPGKLDRRALFDCMAGVLRDGRIVQAPLMAALRLVYYSPSAAHFIEFFATVLFVHQVNVTQLDCQAINRFLTTPHPLRFLVRGRLDIPAEQLLEAAMRKTEMDAVSATANALEASGACFGENTSSILDMSMAIDGSAVTISSSASDKEAGAAAAAAALGRRGSSILSQTASFVSRQKQKALVKWQLQEVQQQQRKKLLAGLTSPALDVSRRVAGEELYFLFDYLSTATTATSWSWTDLKTLVTPDDGTAGGVESLLFPSALSPAGAKGGGSSSAAPAAILMSGDPKEAEKMKRLHEQLLQRHEHAIAHRREMNGDDTYAGTSCKLRRVCDCVVVAKLMSELKAP